MGTKNWIGWSWKGAALLAAGALGGGAAVAVATVPDSSGVIHACVEVSTAAGTLVPDTSAQNLTVIDPGAGQHCISPDGTDTIQTELSWNVQGRPGTATYTVVPPIVHPGTPPEGSAKFGTGSGAIKFGDVLSFGFGARGSTATGKVNTSELNVTKLVDKSSANLFKACARGQHFHTVILSVRKKGSNPMKYLVITLDNVIITADQAGSSKGGERPTETLTLNFSKVEFKYTQ